MSNLVVILVCLGLGLAFQRLKQFPENAATTLNMYVIYVALPALVLVEIPKLTFNHEALVPVISAWTIMVFIATLTWFTARALQWSREITGALMLVVVLGNTSFVGIPLIEAHLGAAALPYAILYDQFGTFLALNTFGIIVAGYYSSTITRRAQILKNILVFPPFIALIVAFSARLTVYPEWMSTALSRISSTLVPVVMIAVGLQWRFKLESAHFLPFIIGLFYILILTPTFAWLGMWGMGIDGLVAKVVVLEAAMPAMISAGVLAVAHNLAPRLASSLVGYSVLLSLLSVWVWQWILR